MRKRAYRLADEYGQDFATSRKARGLTPDTDEWFDALTEYALAQLSGDTLYQFLREYMNSDDLREIISEWDEFYDFLGDLGESARMYIN